MPSIPLPQEPIQVSPGGAFTAFRTVPQQSAVPQQIAELGGAVESAGGALADIADVIQDDYDTARATEAYNLWNDQNRQTLYDPDGGYLNLQGKDATGQGRKRAQDRIFGEAEGISRELDNETQRSVFRQFVQQRTTEVLTQMDRHEAAQGRVYKAGQRQSMQRAAVGDSIEAQVNLDPETYQKQKGVAVLKAREISRDLGYSEEQAEEFVQQTTSAIHLGVVERLVDEGRGDEARAYVDGIDMEEVRPQDRGPLRNRVERASLNQRSAQQALELIDDVDALVSTSAEGGPADPQAPAREAPEDVLMRTARGILEQRFRDGEISIEEMDATMARVQEEARFRRDVRVQESTDALLQAQAWLDENRRAGVAQLPADLYERLRETGQLATINLFADNRRYTTDPRVYASLLDLGRNPHLLRKPNGDLMTEGEFFLTYRPHLDDQRLNQVMAGYRVMTQSRPSQEDVSIWTPTERINAALRAAGIKDDAKIEAAEREIQRRVNEATPRGGDPPKGEALQPIIDSVLLDNIRVPESFVFDFLNPDTVGAPTFLTPEQVAQGVVEVDGQTVRLRDIPPEVRTFIEEGFRARGIPHTFTGVAQAWLRAGAPQSLAEADQGAESLQRVFLGRPVPRTGAVRQGR